tara:strand:- start:3326 stop:3553 length:228 start_codon:yes stop_codon:yes gene_type:complete
MRRLIQRVLFGKRKNYRRYNDNNVKYWDLRHLQDELNTTNKRLNNLLKHLKLETVGNSNLVGDKKDGKKFNGQWN